MDKGLRRDQPCNIVIMGASGDLCKRKLIPALFSLFTLKMLPEDFHIFGFARTKMSDDDFRSMVQEYMHCRYESQCAINCDEHQEEFLQRCHYFAGQYDSNESFAELNDHIAEVSTAEANRLFYMSIPPSVFVDTANSLGGSGIMNVPDDFWARVVLEKPFGRDSESSRELAESLEQVFTEDQIYRIDHYLGKEVIQNLLILRFGNLILEPLWNRNYIDYVSISFSEHLGLEGRAGYFDHFGIIRDVMQNHLMQILALVAMEQPVKLNARYIADEKVKVLRCIAPLTLNDIIVGQYAAGELNGEAKVGYLEEENVPKNSTTETYAHATFRINNPRWSGVPFYLSAGKALDTKKTEIHVQFKDTPYSIFNPQTDIECSNDLHIRVQPNEAIEFHLANKVPGLGMDMQLVKLDMLYQETFDTVLPEAYERLLLDVIRGDHSLFIQDEELSVSWDIVTPVLHELDEKEIKPLPYPYGSHGPQHGLPT